MDRSGQTHLMMRMMMIRRTGMVDTLENEDDDDEDDWDDKHT